jgi:hypothetical protein
MLRLPQPWFQPDCSILFQDIYFSSLSIISHPLYHLGTHSWECSEDTTLNI